MTTLTSSLGARCQRAFKHLTTTAAAGRRAFPAASLTAIQETIAKGELLHSAEVRLIVEVALGVEAVFSDTGNRARALALFAQYGIWDTEENCGVLIYVNLAEHAVEIVADRNVARRIKAAEWESICQTMTQGFGVGAFHESTLVALNALNELLRQHFPSTGARPNQLSNDALIV